MVDVHQLRRDIVSGEVLVPGDGGYERSLKRWSVAAEKKAVSFPQPSQLGAIYIDYLLGCRCKAYKCR